MFFSIFIRILDYSVGMEGLYDLGLGGASTRFGEKVLFYPKLFCESRCNLLYVFSFDSIFSLWKAHMDTHVSSHLLPTPSCPEVTSMLVFS